MMRDPIEETNSFHRRDDKIVIVMPVANEEETIANVLDAILAYSYPNLWIYLIIDSYSKDNTEIIAHEYEIKTDGKVKVIFYAESTGVASCYLEGFRHALKDEASMIIEMDGGGSHSPKELPQFIEKLEEGYDCVWGSRYIDGGGVINHPPYRRILSYGGTILSNIVLGTKTRDMTSGFEGFQRRVLNSLNFDKFLSSGHMFQTEMRFYCRNYKTVEVPIRYTGGASSLKLKSVLEAFVILFRLKRNEEAVRRK